MKWKYVLALIIVAVSSFYLGTSVKNPLQVQAAQETQAAQSSQETQSTLKQFTPVPPTDAAEAKAHLGIIGDIGFRVKDVEAGSPAEQMGIQQGDMIMELDGKQFYSIKDFLSIMAGKEPGDAVTIGCVRFNKEMGKSEGRALNVTLDHRPR